MKRRELPGADHQSVDVIAAELLRAQEVRVPATVEELQQASECACGAADEALGNGDRLQAMKDDDGSHDAGAASTPFEIWIDGTLALDEMFFETEDGALGSQLIELASLDDAAFAERKDDARALLQHTANVALELYPSMHRLVTLGFGADRRAVVEKLSAGDLIQQEHVHGTAITPRRKTVIGLLRDLDGRLPEDERTNIWTLEVPPELPTTIVLSDPFQSGSRDLEVYWSERINEKPLVRGKEATIWMLSEDRTTQVVFDLERIAAHSSDEELQRAAQTIVDWLHQKQIYYQDPDPRDFELYHLGMEGPEVLTSILTSLDVVKHADPELFCDFAGIDAVKGRRSPYFGSFLHKALYNTQRLFESTSPELGVTELKAMITQLLTVDGYVEEYGAGISRESLRAMAMREVTRQAVSDAPTPAAQAQTLMMTAVSNAQAASRAERVREQLAAAREASPENILEELRRHIADIEHPLKLAEYIGLLPESAGQDIRVVEEIRKIFKEHPFGIVRAGLRAKMYYKTLYDRIPMIDETREDLGFALRLRIALRDAYVITRTKNTMLLFTESSVKGAQRHLVGIVPLLVYSEDVEAMKDSFGGILEQRFVASVSDQSRASLMQPDGPGTFVSRVEAVEGWGDEERAFFLDQALILCATRKLETDERYVTAIFNGIERNRPDLALLSVIAHPQGKEVAFTYFEKFCDMIPPDRMVQILQLNAGRVREFIGQFTQVPSHLVRAYLGHLLEDLEIRPEGRGSDNPSGALSWRYWDSTKSNARMITLLKEINTTIVTGKTPWTREISVKAINSHGNEGYVRILIDAWEIWSRLSLARLSPAYAGSQDCSAWQKIDAYDRHDPSTEPKKYRPEEIAEIIAEYFSPSSDREEERQHICSQIIKQIQRKRDDANPKVRRSY